MFLSTLLLIAITSALVSRSPPESLKPQSGYNRFPLRLQRESILSHIPLAHVALLSPSFASQGRHHHRDETIESQKTLKNDRKVGRSPDAQHSKEIGHEDPVQPVQLPQPPQQYSSRSSNQHNIAYAHHAKYDQHNPKKYHQYNQQSDHQITTGSDHRHPNEETLLYTSLINQRNSLHPGKQQQQKKIFTDKQYFQQLSSLQRQLSVHALSNDKREHTFQKQVYTNVKTPVPGSTHAQKHTAQQSSEQQRRGKSAYEEEELQLEEELHQHEKEKHQQIQDQLSEQLLKQRQGSQHDGFQSFPFQRKPPRIPNNPLGNAHLFTDQSEYIRLGDEVGSVLAIGDFTMDRYSDLLVVLNTHRLRCVAILFWDHHSYSFRRAATANMKSSSFSSPFCIDSIPSIPSNAVIASASTLDANADGLLDVLLIVHRSKTKHFGCILLGDGTGKLAFDQIIADVNSYSLIMDANDDMRADIFSITPKGERVFYINEPPGIFTRHVWEPYPQNNGSSYESHSSTNLHELCKPTYPFNSNSFVDINGDCLPDLVVTTKCGMEVWLNQQANITSNSLNLKLLQNGHFSGKPIRNFHHLNLPEHEDSYMMLNKTVWDFDNDESHAVFFDFNSDGAIDIAVINTKLRNIRISYNIRRPRVDRKLCVRDDPVRFITRTALSDVEISALNFGPTIVPPMLHVGDFNYDGLADLLFVDRDSGTLSLYTARLIPESRAGWLDRSRRETHSPSSTSSYSSLSSLFPPTLVQRLIFAFTGERNEPPRVTADMVTYVRCVECSVLQNVEDPVAAAFFDVDESGRQDILISQQRGTRLIWNNYEHTNDLVYFKATGVNSANPSANLSNSWMIHPQPSQPSQPPPSSIHAGPSSSSYAQPFSPLPGNTFKISYGGRHRRETQTCTQCPQSSLLTLHSCSCLFGITRIANYIEEMAMGGAGGVRSWMALMPNALAIIWPQHPPAPGGFIKWRVSYLSKGRDGQLKRIVYVLCVTLAILLVAILYMHNAERCENRASRTRQFGYVYS